ncbi:MAG: arylamine N-acetyltransferase [Verrucomicrobia bacterium]|nr:arylamine N-acetyltransferase [Verrucomicrobiota bacterium]MBS0636493.1 arylamine N-acetyltransferase [Verrucomicrobiota bacterium]
MDIDTYLARIGYDGSREPSSEMLQKLYYQHVSTVPFENIDYFLERPVSLEKEAIYEKIVTNRRGGGCYELSGLFYELLRALGFQATMVASKLYKGAHVDEESRHATIQVTVDGKVWFLDPGYGENGLIYPLELALDLPQKQKDHFYRFTMQDGKLIFSRSRYGEEWHNLLELGDKPVTLAAFLDRHCYHLTNPNSIAKKTIACSLLTHTGEKSLVNSRYQNKPITSSEELHTILTKEFGLNIARETSEAIFKKASLL